MSEVPLYMEAVLVLIQASLNNTGEAYCQDRVGNQQRLSLTRNIQGYLAQKTLPPP